MTKQSYTDLGREFAELVPPDETETADGVYHCGRELSVDVNETPTMLIWEELTPAQRNAFRRGVRAYRRTTA